MRATPKPKKKPSRKGKVKKLDAAFSLYIRTRDEWRCVTCGSTDRVKMQCGHLFSRSSYSTRWDEENAFCQCAGCNLLHEYDPGPLTLHYLTMHSIEEYEELHKEYRTPRKFKDYELDELIQRYEGRTKAYVYLRDYHGDSPDDSVL